MIDGNKIVIEYVETPSQITELANLAEEIWMDVFTPISGQAKAKYLLNNMLSIDAIIRSIGDEGYSYWFINIEGNRAGFLAFKPEEDMSALMLSKLYLRKEYRGMGYGRYMINFVHKQARDLGFEKIYLSCARDNKKAIQFYKHIGFEIVESTDTDVGDGYQMNDYIFESVVW